MLFLVVDRPVTGSWCDWKRSKVGVKRGSLAGRMTTARDLVTEHVLCLGKHGMRIPLSLRPSPQASSGSCVPDIVSITSAPCDLVFFSRQYHRQQALGSCLIKLYTLPSLPGMPSTLPCQTRVMLKVWSIKCIKSFSEINEYTMYSSAALNCVEMLCVDRGIRVANEIRCARIRP